MSLDKKWYESEGIDCNCLCLNDFMIFYKKIFICFKLSINVQNYKINCGQRSTPRHRPNRLCPYANEVNRLNLRTEPPIGCSQFAWLLGEHVGTPWNGVRMRDPVEIGCAPLVRGIVWEIFVIFGDDLDTYGYTWDFDWCVQISIVWLS